MRSIAILAACATMTVGVVPMVVHAQTSTTTTVKTDTKSMWEKIKGSWSQTKGTVKEQWGKLTDDDLMRSKAIAISSSARSRPATASRMTRPRPRSALGKRSTRAICSVGDTHKSGHAIRAGPPVESRWIGPFSLGPFTATLRASEQGVMYA